MYPGQWDLPLRAVHACSIPFQGVGPCVWQIQQVLHHEINPHPKHSATLKRFRVTNSSAFFTYNKNTCNTVYQPFTCQYPQQCCYPPWDKRMPGGQRNRKKGTPWLWSVDSIKEQEDHTGKWILNQEACMHRRFQNCCWQHLQQQRQQHPLYRGKLPRAANAGRGAGRWAHRMVRSGLKGLQTFICHVMPNHRNEKLALQIDV